MTILLIKGLSMEGSSKGLKFLFYPDFDKLTDLKVWEDAFVQILYSSGIGFGPLILFASARDKNEPIKTASLSVPLINSATSIFASLTIFSFLGYVSNELGIPIEEISQGGMDLAFIAYPGMMTLLPWPNMWSIFFFVMLITVGIDSIFGLMDFILQYIIDAYPVILQNMRKEIYVLGMCCIFFITDIPFVTKAGFYYFDLFNTYAAGISLLTITTIEVFALTYGFGIDKLESLMKH